MERDLFDQFTRRIAEIASRRRALQQIIGGGALTALAGHLSLVEIDAKKKKRKKRKKKKCKVRKCPKPANPCQKAVCRKHKCRTQDQPDGTACGTGLECLDGECACPTGEKLCDGACIPAGDPCFQTVTPGDLRGWLLEGEDPFSQSPLLTQIVNGPETPPRGTGSVQLDPTAFAAFPEDQTQAVVRTLQYEGTAISEIERLSYSVFVPAGGDPPTLQLAVTGVNNSANFASFVFIPGQFGNVAPSEDDWSEYTPTEAGFWVATRDVLGPGDACLICRFNSASHEGQCAVPANCAPVTAVDWDAVVAAAGDAQLNDSGSFSFRIGRGDTGQGNVTNIVFNDDGYVFETD